MRFAIEYTAEQVDEAVAILEQHHMRFIKTTTKTKGQAVPSAVWLTVGQGSRVGAKHRVSIRLACIS